MDKFKKTTAAFLSLSLILAGCTQNHTQKGTDSPPVNAASTDTHDASAPASKTSAAGSNGPETMLLERDVPLPKTVGKKETAVSLLLNGRHGIELFTHDKANNIYQYVLQNDAWEKQALQFPDQIKTSAGLDRLEIIRGEDGRYYAFYALSDETYHLEATDDLKTFEDVAPPQWKEAPGSKNCVIPAKVFVSENGILCAIVKYEDTCKMYDLKNGGDILGEFGVSSYQGLTIQGNRLFSETIDGKGAFIYDIQKQEKARELESSLTNQAVYEMAAPDEMYACNDNGIYTLSSGKWQLLVDSSLNTLADPNFSWQNIRHAGERIYILFQSAQALNEGKAKEGLSLKYFEYSTDIPDIDTTLTIWGLEENASIKNTLAAFRKEHPNVRVVYEIASDISDVMTTDDIIRQFNAGIFAGNGPDMLLLDGLHMDTYIERGLLYDMENELSDIKPQLLPGVQKLLEENAFAVPLRSTLPFIIGPKDILDDSLDTFLQKSSGKQPAEMIAENIFDICYHFFSEGLALNKPGATKEDITAFLELCKKAAENWRLNDSPKNAYKYADSAGCVELAVDLAWERTDFAFSYAYGLNQFCDMLDSIDQLSAKGIDYHAAGNYFLPQGMLAINQQSPNKELSIEFIQKALSADLQESDFSDGFPVNTKALDSWGSRQSNMMLGIGNRNGEAWNTQWPSSETLQRFVQSIKETDKPVFIERYTQDCVKAEAIKVISKDTTAEAAASRILSQLELYYGE